MPGKPPLTAKSRVSWLSRFRKRVSLLFSPSSLASVSHDTVLISSSGGDTEEVNSSSRHADPELPPTFGLHLLSTSGTSAPFATNTLYSSATLSSQPSTYRLEDQADHNLAPPLSHPLSQGQVFTYGRNQIFNQAQNFVVRDTTFIENNIGGDNFIEKLLQETIIGAEFDSSARDPPPRCHPGTRLAIIQRCLDFIIQCHDEEKLRWVVGPAGVGKSAVLQMITETVYDSITFASIFISINGRNDGKKTIITIAYQLAIKCGPYRQFIRDQITFDPSLLKKSLSVQFKKFIIEPFNSKCIFEPSRRFLVVIDGLDECDDHATQRKLLELITDFCITNPTSPIAWIISSRPEPHITQFFDKAEVKRAYTKEEILIDSNDACEEVQRYLRDELKKIKDEHPTLRHRREWPLEFEFTKLASAAGGLFAYAATVTRYIGNPTNGGPAAQLRHVLEIVDAVPKDHVPGRGHPMDQLDTLYRRILSNVPDHAMTNTRKLLILQSYNRFHDLGFRTQCNALGLTEDEAYDAIRHLHAVMKIPEPGQADDQLSYYHKSFDDFLRDFKRSGFSRDFRAEGHQLDNLTSLRIIEEVHDGGVAKDEDVHVDSHGLMKGHCDNILLSWPCDERFHMTDEENRIILYQNAIRQARIVFSSNKDLQKSIYCFHVLTTRFTISPYDFPFDEFLENVFDRFRDELTKLGKLKRVTLRTLQYAAVCGNVKLQFLSPTGKPIKGSSPWNPSCQHWRGRVNDLWQREGWLTTFKRYYRIDSGTEDNKDTSVPRFHCSIHQPSHKKWYESNRSSTYPVTCIHCSQRFAQHFINNQDLLATVFVDGTEMSYVEVIFIDPADGVSKWRYRFLHSGRPSGIAM